MSGIITTLKKENFQNLPISRDYVYPVTVLDAIYDDTGNPINLNFEKINKQLGLLEEKLNSIQNTQTSINNTLTEVKNKNNTVINLVDNLENRILAIEDLRQNILSIATVRSSILTDINNLNSFTSESGYNFANTPTVLNELERIHSLLQEQFGEFNISVNGFLLICYNNSKYCFAIMKQIENGFNNPVNWFVIDNNLLPS